MLAWHRRTGQHLLGKIDSHEDVYICLDVYHHGVVIAELWWLSNANYQCFLSPHYQMSFVGCKSLLFLEDTLVGTENTPPLSHEQVVGLTKIV